MKNKLSSLKTGKAVLLYLALLGAVYVIANSCASSLAPPLPHSGRIFGQVWVDSIPPSPTYLHLHGALIIPDSAATGAQRVAEDNIPLYFFPLDSGNNGKYAFLRNMSYFRTNDSTYAAGIWQLDSVYITDSAGSIWENNVLHFNGLRLPSNVYESDTFNFIP